MISRYTKNYIQPTHIASMSKPSYTSQQTTEDIAQQTKKVEDTVKQSKILSTPTKSYSDRLLPLFFGGFTQCHRTCPSSHKVAKCVDRCIQERMAFPEIPDPFDPAN